MPLGEARARFVRDRRIRSGLPSRARPPAAPSPAVKGKLALSRSTHYYVEYRDVMILSSVPTAWLVATDPKRPAHRRDVRFRVRLRSGSGSLPVPSLFSGSGSRLPTLPQPSGSGLLPPPPRRRRALGGGTPPARGGERAAERERDEEGPAAEPHEGRRRARGRDVDGEAALDEQAEPLAHAAGVIDRRRDAGVGAAQHPAVHLDRAEDRVGEVHLGVAGAAEPGVVREVEE